MKTVLVHPERCIGCKQCEAACAVAHSQTQNLFLAVFEKPSSRTRIHVEPGLELTTSFPNKCRHCNPAPCQATCPTGAIHRPADFSEIVLVEARRCIACGMCAMICPFDAVTYHPVWNALGRPMVAVKCDHCIERQRHEKLPACVEACKVGALEFGELNELIKAGRERYSEQVLQAASQGVSLKAIEQIPLSIEIWHGWGEVVTALNANGGRA